MNAPSNATRANIELAWDMGDMMRDYFGRPELCEERKADRSPVTEADMAVSIAVVRFFQASGRRVVSEEEGRTAEYGNPDAEYLDPIDATEDFMKARRLGRQSIAAFSLGSAANGSVVRGIVNLPLLDVPRLYWAEDGVGTFRVMGRGQQAERLENAPQARGAILVSQNRHPYIERLKAMGYTTVSLGGAVFKACCVADPSLLRDFNPALLPPGEQVVGFISDSAQAHDYAAAQAIAQNTGVLVCGVDGAALRLTAGKHGCIFAGNETAQNDMIEAVAQGDHQQITP